MTIYELTHRGLCADDRVAKSFPETVCYAECVAATSVKGRECALSAKGYLRRVPRAVKKRPGTFFRKGSWHLFRRPFRGTRKSARRRGSRGCFLRRFAR